MPRVSTETIKKLNAFIDSLPEESRNKCALCNETLTDIVKKAEVATNAGTRTVTRALSDKINEKAASGDTVTPETLRNRVKRTECDAPIGSKRPNKPDSKPEPYVEPEPVGDMDLGYYSVDLSRINGSYSFAKLAIGNLQSIPSDEPFRKEAIEEVYDWCKKQLGI